MPAGEWERVLASPYRDFDRERRRIEATLHDGVQQDLAAAAVSLQLALQQLDVDCDAARSLIEGVVRELEASLERVRELAASIYPSRLVAHSRHPVEVEEAVYFSCRSLGAEPRTWEEADELRFEIAGTFDEASLAEARARVASVGGQLAVSPGRVTGAIPLSSSAR